MPYLILFNLQAEITRTDHKRTEIAEVLSLITILYFAFSEKTANKTPPYLRPNYHLLHLCWGSGEWEESALRKWIPSPGETAQNAELRRGQERQSSSKCSSVVIHPSSWAVNQDGKDSVLVPGLFTLDFGMLDSPSQWGWWIPGTGQQWPRAVQPELPETHTRTEIKPSATVFPWFSSYTFWVVLGLGCFVELFFRVFLTALKGEWVMIHSRSLLDNMSIFTALSLPGEEGTEAAVGATPCRGMRARFSPHLTRSSHQLKYDQNEICEWCQCKEATAHIWVPSCDQAMPMAREGCYFPLPASLCWWCSWSFIVSRLLAHLTRELNCFLLLPQHRHMSLSQLTWILCPTFFPWHSQCLTRLSELPWDDPRVVVLTAGFPQAGWGGSSRLGYHSGFPKEKQAGSARQGLWSNLVLMAGLVLRSYQAAQALPSLALRAPKGGCAISLGCLSQALALLWSRFFSLVSNFNIFSSSCLISKPCTPMKSLNAAAQEPAFLLVIAVLSPWNLLLTRLSDLTSLCLPSPSKFPAPNPFGAFSTSVFQRLSYFGAGPKSG